LQNRGFWRARAVNNGVIIGLSMRIPYSTEQVIIFAKQGILSQEQVISPAKTEINAG
jgi:hypothetical protein